MNKLSKLAAAVATCAALAVPSAFAQAQGGHDMKPMMQNNMDKMMSMQLRGEPDVDFAMMMREHHKGGSDRRPREERRPPDVRSAAPPRKSADPDSPFASLGALRETLAKKAQEKSST